MRIYHFDIVKNSKLGFGDRLVFWLSGCPFRCRGCIAEDFLEIERGKEYSVDEVVSIIERSSVDRVTFSGGEPLYQAKELLSVLESIDKDTMLFSGYYRYELDDIQRLCYEKFDLVVEGRFEENKRGNFLWRGSSNQIFSSPTGKYTTILPKLYQAKSAGLEIVIDEYLYFYGVPTSEDEIEKIKRLMIKEGVSIVSQKEKIYEKTY